MSKSEVLKTLEGKIAQVVEEVSIQRTPHFYRDEIVVSVMRDGVVSGILKGVTSLQKEIIVRWIENEITEILGRTKDAYGIRLYENYPTFKLQEDEGFGGARRWLRTGSQGSKMFRILSKQPEREARQLVAKSEVYQEIADRLEKMSARAGREVHWDEVRDQIGPQLAVLRLRVATVLRS